MVVVVVCRLQRDSKQTARLYMCTGGRCEQQRKNCDTVRVLMRKGVSGRERENGARKTKQLVEIDLTEKAKSAVVEAARYEGRSRASCLI